jgi:hypothetical protein
MLLVARMGLASRPPGLRREPNKRPMVQGKGLGLVGLDFIKYIHLLCVKILLTERRKSGRKLNQKVNIL